MKKMKFTLGLMLSILILGANVAKAEYLNSYPHDGFIEMYVNIPQCDFYNGTVNMTLIVKDANEGYGYQGDVNLGNYNAKAKAVDWSYIGGIPYGSSSWGSVPVVNNLEKDYYWNPYLGTAGRYVPATWGSFANLFYYQVKSKTEITQRIQIKLDYKGGNELTPVIKRTVQLGEWVTITNPTNEFQKKNVLIPNGVEFTRYFHEKGSYRVEMDRKTGIATYTFDEDILSLLTKHGSVISNIYYEIEIHDEFDNPSVPYDPPTGTNPTTQIGVKFAPTGDIKTDPNHLGGNFGVHYFPTGQDLKFKVFSADPIEIKLTLDNPEKTLPKGCLSWVDNKNGSFTVVVKQLKDNMTIGITAIVPTSGEGENGETGNEFVTADKVWASAGTLYVETANSAVLSIYSVTGQLVQQVQVNGTGQLALPKGLYIVQLNGKAYKIVN